MFDCIVENSPSQFKKTQTSNLSNQETRGAFVKSKKAPLGKTAPPTFNYSEKTMFHLNQNQKNTNIQLI
jgi:hypothetical protein